MVTDVNSNGFRIGIASVLAICRTFQANPRPNFRGVLLRRLGWIVMFCQPMKKLAERFNGTHWPASTQLRVKVFSTFFPDILLALLSRRLIVLLSSALQINN